MAELIQVQDLTRKFGDIVAVDRIQFSVSRGDVLGFLGPNGAGKSTTMKMITGFLTPSEGQVLVAGLDPAESPIEVKSKIGYLPENSPLYEDMSVAEFLNFILKIRDVPTALRTAAFDRAVRLTNIERVLRQRIETLSKGYRRRVGLAQALIHDPEILILDEPTDGLDPNQKYEVRNLIRGMASEKAIILSTHILEEVNAVCNRAIIISNGKIVADSSPIELRKQSASAGRIRLSFATALSEEERVALSKLPGVASVEVANFPSGEAVYSIQSEPNHQLETFLLQEMERRRWNYKGFSVDSGELDDVFRTLTHSERV